MKTFKEFLNEKKINIDYKNMPEKEFEIEMRKRWNKYQKNVHPDDSIPFWEYYSEMCASYGRKQPGE